MYIHHQYRESTIVIKTLFQKERELNVFLSDSADCAKQMVQPIKTNFTPPKSIIADWL